MSRLSELMEEMCPDGVEYVPIKEKYTRLRGTPITALKMREIENADGNIIVYAGGKTVVNAFEHDIPNANITRVPAVIVQSRGIVDFIYCDRPCTFKNELWAYTCDEKISVKFLYYVLKNNAEYFRKIASQMGAMPQISLSVTEDFLVPMPPLPVQAEIVRILDKWADAHNGLIALLEAELADRKKQYAYYLDKLLTFTPKEKDKHVARTL